MPVRQLRRLEAPTGQSLHARLSRETLSYAWGARDVDEIPERNPELIIESDGNVLAALRGDPSRLAYAYESDAAFIDQFPAMLARLLPRVRKSLGAGTVRFRLDVGSSRSAVEPVLKQHWFKRREPWLTFVLDKRSASGKSTPPKGVVFRDGTLGDLPAIAHIDRVAFPDEPMPESNYRQRLQGRDSLLVAAAGADVAVFAVYSYDGADEGYLSVLAVAEAYRGRGIGPALTMRVAKWAFGQGASRLALRTEERNGTAIKAYRALGFRHTGSGNDYDRPTDPNVIAAMKKSGEGTLIRFGGWR